MALSTTEISGSLDLTALQPARRIAAHLVQERGEPPDWRLPLRRTNLACAIIDAVMAPRISTGEVDKVVARYVGMFPDSATSSDLVQTFAILSLQGWRDQLGTRHRVYANLEAPYKSDIIEQAAKTLATHGVQKRSDLKARAEDTALRAAWCAMPGHHSGSSWRHLLLISGVDHPLVCPLTKRFVRRALKGFPLQMNDADIVASMTDVAEILATTPQHLDHQMWRAGAGAPHAGARYAGARSPREEDTHLSTPTSAVG